MKKYDHISKDMINIDNQKEDNQLKEMLGFGETSSKKSYYPELQNKIEELEKEKERYQRIFAEAISGIFQTTVNGKITIANPSVVKILGYNNEFELYNLCSVRDQIFVTTREYNKIINFIEKTGNLIAYESELKKSDGTLIYVSLNVSKIEIGKEVVYEFFIDDISKRKNSEIELVHARNFISNIIDSMPSVLICVDENCRITQWNRKSEEVTGIKDSIAIGGFLTDIYKNESLNTKLIEESIKLNDIKVIKSKYREVNGEAIFENFTIYPLIEDGVKGAVVRVDDVTKEVQITEKLNQSSKMDAIGQLAGGVAHDFNNMLSGIMSSAELLKMSNMVNNDGIRFIDFIISSVSKASGLTSKLLTFGRKGAIELTNIDTNLIINDVVTILQRTLDKSIEIIVDNKIMNSVILGDYSAIQNALLNLGINASHALTKGGSISIISNNIHLDKSFSKNTTFEISSGDYIKIDVIDNGCGIEESNLKKIFEPFFTTKGVGKGTGLGLASVYGTIQEHQGAIVVKSDVGVGTTFSMYLPCSDEYANILNESCVDLVSGEGLVLFVDDEEIIRRTCKFMLEDLGYTVLVASDGEDAVEIYKQRYNEIDAVIMDMIMPKMNGKEAFKKMIAIDKNCRIILSSGYTEDRDISELKKCGLHSFIQKPYKFLDLTNVLNS